MKADSHPFDGARLQRLASYGILDTPEEPEFDAVVQLAAQICETPVALISLVDRTRQWFKARRGDLPAQTPIELSICAHAILGDGPLVIEDTTADLRTADNALCVGPEAFQFYAGAPIVDPSGLPLGSLCVLDTRPRSLSEAQRAQLSLLAQQVMHLIRLREAAHAAETVVQEAHHRIKNSLQSATSNVRRQRRSLGSGTTDVEEALAAVERGLTSASELHDALAISGAAGKIELAHYVRRVMALATADLPERIGSEVVLAPCRIDADRASAIGTILSEFLMNARQHAFPDGRSGTIRVVGRFLDDGSYRLDLSDDGVGMGDGDGRGTSLGLRIIETAILQLGGQQLDEPPAGGTGTLLPIAFRPD